MKLRFWLFVTLALVTALAAGWLAGLSWSLGRTHRHTSEPEWLLIKWYAGAIAPSEEVTARVYVARQFSDRSSNIETFLQNKIEVRYEGASSVFVWPDDKSYAAGWAEVIDLDHNGTKEFMIGSDRSRRIVSYTRGQFRFRPDLDDILSARYDVGPVDLDSDGRYEFVDGQPIETFPQQYGASVPRIKRWTSESGFVDVSSEFKWYYEQRLIPELQSKLAEEKDSELRSAYEQALREMKGLANRRR